MNRRDFLKTVGIATTATAAACQNDPYDPKVPYEHILPYVKQPEDTLPGVANSFSTMCDACSSGCGLVARSKEGRVVHVSGNPDHPDGGGLCVRGHFPLVDTYAPDRVIGPSQGGKLATWEETLAGITAAISAAKAAGKTVAWLGRYRTASTSHLLDQLTAGIGLRRVHWEALGAESLIAASKAVFGKASVPRYHLSDARTIVSFGMDFLGTAVDTMHMFKGWSKAKDPASGGFVTRLVCIEPRVGTTSSQADLFLAPKPGTEVHAALALTRLVADLTGYGGPAAGLVAGIDAAASIAACGISEERLKEVAGWFVAGTSVALPGGHANAGVDATALATATLLLNEVAGNVGKTVGFGRAPKLGQVDSYRDVKALLADAAAGKIGVLFVDGVNPVYSLPAVDKAAEALGAVDTLVQFGNEADDSTLPKTWLLPPGTSLEGWGDSEATTGVYVLQQPAMTPIHDVRSVGDVLLAIGKALVPAGYAAPSAAPPPVVPEDPTHGGTAIATPVVGEQAVVAEDAGSDPDVHDPANLGASYLGFAYDNFGGFVKEHWRRYVFSRSGQADFEAFWLAARQRGVVDLKVKDQGATASLAALPVASAGLAGNDLALVVFPSSILGDGRHANNPWAQELPDPVSTTTWTTWAEISPATAERMGLSPTDTLKITTPDGSINVGFFASPGVRDDTVAVMLGNGHKGMGRYARGRGANPMGLLSAQEDAASGALATYTSRAIIAKAGGNSDFFALVGHLTQDNRGLVPVVNAEEALANLKGEAGGIVPLHEPELDKRLVDQGITDMYPEPQHPTYRFAMAIDTNVCNGCMACVVACNLENNIPFVGPDQVRKGRTMSWIRMDRFFEGSGEHPDVRHMPSLCQHCAHAPCEGVCPVLATYHNLDGLNAMIYNRCVGTRYCANNCPYTARRFNYHTFEWPQSFHLMLNPDVSTREMGVMEKCSFCVQRIRGAKDTWRDVHEEVPDVALRKLTACAAACPSNAITFGNAKNKSGLVAEKFASPRTYTLLGELNTKPGIRYMARVRHDAPKAEAHHAGGGHHEGGAEGGHEGAAKDAHHKEG